MSSLREMGMKKLRFMVPVLTVLLVTGQAVFAQEGEGKIFDVSGTLTTGLWAHFTDMIDQGPFIKAMGDEGLPVLFEFKSRLSTPDGNAGLRLNLEASTGDMVVDKLQNISLDKSLGIAAAYGWLKAFNGILTVYGGYWDPEIYETMGPLESDLGMKHTGMIAEVSPLPGLNVALSAWAKKGNTTLLGEGKYMFSASYEIDNMFRVLFNYAHHQFDNLGFTEEDNPNTYREQAAKDHRLNFSFNWLGFEDTLGFSKLALDFEMRDLGGGRLSRLDHLFRPTGEVVRPLYMGEWIQWGIGAVTVNFKAYQLFLIGDDREEYAPSLRFSLSGSYQINNYIVPKLGFAYYLNSLVWDNHASDLRFEEGVNWEDAAKDMSGLGVRLACEFRFTGLVSSFLEIGYSVKADTSKDAEAAVYKSTLDHGYYAMLKITL